MTKPFKIKLFSAFLSFVFLSACSSSGPATSFYTLFPTASSSSSEELLEKPVIGVALVRLPGYLETSAVVSRSGEQKLNVSGHHAWAEDLDEAVTRVIAGNLRTVIKSEVVAFPWDSRMRPEWQVNIHIHRLDGERGGEVTLSANWAVYSVKNKKVLQSGYFDQNLATEKADYASYAKAINALVNNMSADLILSIR